MSRGRGGGRGGRGGMIKSFNREQLSAMGIANNEMLPTLVTQPPPLFPLMERHPIPLTQSYEMDYLLILRQDFVDHIQLASSYIRMPDSKPNQPQQEIEKLAAQLPSSKEKFDWALLPAELRPKVLAKRMKKEKTKGRDVNVQDKLKALEELEESKKAVQIKQEKADDDEEEEAVEHEEEDQEDEEMDDGTDYANNYFDNGEGYEDDDDNMDEGPIY